MKNLMLLLLLIPAIVLADSKDYISLREVSDRLTRLETIIDLKFQEMDKALVLKTIEIDRRLQGLNELRNDVVKDRDQFVSRNVYEIERKELSQLANRVIVIETRMITWGSVLTISIILIQIFIKIFWK